MDTEETSASSHDSIRAFLAIALPPALADEVQSLQRQLQSHISGDFVRWTRRDQLHLTLKFFGNIPSDSIGELVSALKLIADRTVPFDLAIQGVGCFPSIRRPNVVWVGIVGDLDGLRVLQTHIESVTSHFGRQSEPRDFRPHLTIGRAKAPRRCPRSLAEAIQSVHITRDLPWPVKEMELIKSTLSARGSAYTRLARIELKGLR